MKKTYALVAFLCLSLVIMAQSSKLSNYSRSFLDAKTTAQSEQQRTNFRKHYGVKLVAEQEFVSAYIHFNDAVDTTILEQYGATIVSDFGTIITAQIPADQLEALSNEAVIKFIEIGTPVRKKMAAARTGANVDKVQAGTNLSHPFLGTNVVVGVVDGGFQYNHINFYDLDNTSELRVKRVWKQSTNQKYTTQTAIEAAKYDDSSDEDGHATHVTGIAAGSYSGNSYYGIAKDADIVMVSMGNTNTDISNGVKYVYDYATEVGKPAVVNLSLGTHIGPHDGTSTFDRTCDATQGPGRLLVGAASNEGDQKLYLEKALAENGTATEAITFDSNYGYEDGYYQDIDIWGDANQTYTVQIIITNSAGTTLWSSDIINATTTTTKTYTSFSSAATGFIGLYASKDATNNKGNVLLTTHNSAWTTGFQLSGTNKLKVKFTATTAGTIRSWADGYGSTWTNGSTNSTVGELGGTGKNIISVGAWTTTARSGYGLTKNAITYFSSKGPTADGRMKPDISAPGAVLASSVPNTSAVTGSSNFDQAATASVGGVTYYWGYMQGTSMASPFVTGVLATWLQADPQLTPAKVREVLSQTAMVDSYTGTCPNNTWGYGKIDAYAGLLNVLGITPIKNLETMPDAIMVYPNPNNGSFKVLFTEADEDLLISVYTMNGQKIVSQHINQVAVQENLDIDLGHVDTGAYIVKVEGKKINETFRLLVR
ncbi:MAG: S8 family peptidase [Paludibacteraceae bacterium]|nr:S8 family peptidase [Paludibacteraceae bacterium]